MAKEKIGEKRAMALISKYFQIKVQQDLDGLDSSACWEDTKLIRFSGDRNVLDFFPGDVNYPGVETINIRCQYELCLGPSKYLDVIFIGCSFYTCDYMNSVHFAGRVNSLYNVRIEDWKECQLIAAGMIYRFCDVL